jgi:hypothetical protein
VVHLRPSRTLLAFLFAGSLVGLLTEGAGLLVGHAANEGPRTIECAPFPMELQRHSSSEFRFTAPADQAVHLDVDFLELNGDIMLMSARPVALTAGATTAFSMPTWHVGSAIQVIASGPVQVDATLVYDGSVGQAEHRTVPCKLIPRPARGGGA